MVIEKRLKGGSTYGSAHSIKKAPAAVGSYSQAVTAEKLSAKPLLNNQNKS
ncbi:hypothetical protein [Pseudobacillus wudalianchiensis]|uniref:hypothetical protein n=1 Tax=Pseudobacillus wudalianchiensis TaxID=1743143 RepID=UPI00159F1587|nr:hypothetical protein [Bacillus wudalianchiensis]